MDNSPYVPPRFQAEVIAHVAGVYSSQSDSFPLILGIFGSPGEGKTYMCEQVLLNYHVKRHIFSVSEFENESSGLPAKKLRETYDEAANNYRVHGVCSVLMINDIDTAIGNWGGMYQYTVNTQHIIGELMQISDPHANQGQRIPIIITGNNFGSIYAPLKRSGRIGGFYWQTNEDELAEILRAGYRELTKDEISRLIRELNSRAAARLSGTLPVSFFTSLKGKLYKQHIYKLLARCSSISKTIALFDREHRNQRISVDELIRVGTEEIDTITAMNKKHLGIEVQKNGCNEDNDKDHNIPKEDPASGKFAVRL